MKALLTINIFLAFTFISFSQHDTSVVTPFKDTRIVNSQSSEVERKGYLKFIISHRFGAVNNEFLQNFFGLDNATVRLGLDYGLSNRITIGAGRSTLEKTFDGFVKWKTVEQNHKTPVTVTALQSIVYRTQENFAIPEEEDTPLNKLAYSTEVYISRLFGERFALQLTPTFTYRNLVETAEQSNAIFSQGIVMGYKISHKVAINLEYFYTPNFFVNEAITDPLSLGVDIGTNGHVFQFFMSNARGMNAPHYINKTYGSWLDGDIFFGFNVSRVFRIKAFQ